MQQQFLEIFEQSMHKLNLVGVCLKQKRKNKSGRIFYKILGKFQFVYPLHFDNNTIKLFVENKREILQFLKNADIEYSNCISHKYTKKVKINNKTVKKEKFTYVYDIIPNNIIDFQFKNQKMILYVLGWGM